MISGHPRIERSAGFRMLVGLLRAELAAARGRKGQGMPALRGEWHEGSRLDDSPDGVGCDSLERLWLSSAVNEMFHLHAQPDATSLRQDLRLGAWLDSICATLSSPSAAVTFTTSGSTGQPKRCTHRASYLATEVDFLAQRFADRRRIVALAPAQHIYGCLFTVLLPSWLGITVLEADGLSAGALRGALRPGDLVVSFPERWRWLERSLPAWPEDVQGVVSTAPCPPDLIEALLARALRRMTHNYGSSETPRNPTPARPEPSYELMPHWAFSEPFDPDRPALHHRSGESFALMDRIDRTGTRAFTLAGRLDGAVQVGGVNVDPAAVAAALQTLSGVAAAAVRLMNPHEGNRLKAYIVPTLDAPDLATEIEQWSRAKLPAAQRPTSLTFGPVLPRDALGKAADWAIEP